MSPVEAFCSGEATKRPAAAHARFAAKTTSIGFNGSVIVAADLSLPAVSRNCASAK